ncbi:hypothetical protein AU255_09010 [Methyloprofundus sedimenti]|uniref:CRISPR-associated protein Cas6 C-terminal domain-containing protein n=1 Tax=Methyloprofundus sedimenti TaxID=1420851 RepID=A0A1V8M8X2_9GAMM|nr:CRISPR system precrRNA processing endoribonuclease RAMP protein Cas6 [Methyloprofundus sedimenti]OQK17978.1 hypothetical protein AU255_09010 [Methyloprofundus sedimenti]
MLELNVHRYQFNGELKAPLQLNAYSGSMLRGAFGNALRKLACVTNMAQCKQCLLYRQCVYPQLFEPPVPLHTELQQFSAIPSPFIIEPPPIGESSLAKGGNLQFNMVLIGQANQQLAFIIEAWKRAFQQGLGKQHAQLNLRMVYYQAAENSQTLIYQAQQPQLQAIPANKEQHLMQTDSITLSFVTPLRIQQKGKILSEHMSAKDFLMALVRRYYLLQEFYGIDYQAPQFSELAIKAAGIACHVKFQWYEWQRYSSRQKQAMKFGGVLGELQLQGDLSEFLSVLYWGQWLHVGNKTSFGMGQYKIA